MRVVLILILKFCCTCCTVAWIAMCCICNIRKCYMRHAACKCNINYTQPYATFNYTQAVAYVACVASVAASLCMFKTHATKLYIQPKPQLTGDWRLYFHRRKTIQMWRMCIIIRRSKQFS